MDEMPEWLDTPTNIDDVIDGNVIHLPKKLLPLTDMGNAERIVRDANGEIRYCPGRRKWITWDGSLWQWDEGTVMYTRAKELVRTLLREASRCTLDPSPQDVAKHALKTQQSSRLNAALDLARWEPGVVIQLDELDTDPWLLHCKNGIVDLKTGKLLAHDASRLISKSTHLNYDPGAQSDLWDRVLREATGGDNDLALYLQRIAGYACAGVASERAFFFLYGRAGTVKSTVLDALKAGLGTYALAAEPETFLARQNVGGNRGDLVRLQGARLVVAPEMRKGARWDEAIVKRITGGDVITAAGKYESEVEFRASCTIIFAANDAPKAREDDDGFWARCRRIPMTAVIQKQDKELKTALASPEHASAILAWAVRGCLAWQQEGLGSCNAVEKSTAEYLAENDTVGEFLAEEMSLEQGHKMLISRFRDRYEGWCSTQGVRPEGQKDIYRRLVSLGVESRKSNGNRWYFGISEAHGL